MDSADGASVPNCSERIARRVPQPYPFLVCIIPSAPSTLFRASLSSFTSSNRSYVSARCSLESNSNWRRNKTTSRLTSADCSARGGVVLRGSTPSFPRFTRFPPGFPPYADDAKVTTAPR